ncbi:hypothetical protein FNAPI_12315 [Fusarium napiforme]|uniref:Uncharacterized protein n=1 Tax=Fusarium napiforme TaxID=42672 RepID=A0A8H5MNG8_9HYPO|nr:hypothetical protein FNAPI_12315 [Fusarium napiforme]
METPTSQEPSVREQLNEIVRHFYYVRKTDVSVFPGAKTLLKMSIQKHMSKYEVEFLEDDQRHRVSVPLDVMREDSEEKFRRIGEISNAMRKAKLLTFFREDSMEELKKKVRAGQTRVSGLEKRNSSATQERKELEVAEDMLRIHEEAMERRKRIDEAWKS